MQQGWGRSISARVGWVIMESPCVILMIIYGLLMRDKLLLVHEIFYYFGLYTMYTDLLYIHF